MVQLTRNQVILAKIESTYRTDPTPTAGANSIEAIDVSITEQSPPLARTPLTAIGQRARGAQRVLRWGSERVV